MLFIEGVGGIMVPLEAKRTVLDWMAALNIPLILVVGGYLGAISHTLTALDVIAAPRAEDQSTVVVNETPARSNCTTRSTASRGFQMALRS